MTYFVMTEKQLSFSFLDSFNFISLFYMYHFTLAEQVENLDYISKLFVYEKH